MTRSTIPDVIDRFRAYHEREPMWGSLHIVLDDQNVSDSNVWFCFHWADEHDDSEGVELALLLIRMSRTQRLKLSRLCRS